MPYANEEMKAARVEAGLTHKELAAKVGRSESHIRNVEGGSKPILDVYLSRIAKAVNRKYHDLLADPPDQPRAGGRAAA